jgi:hypothetical protein
MTDRALFNRQYTSFDSGGTSVWLVNGAGVSSATPARTTSLTASEDLIQGEAVFVSGVWAVPATAFSGASNAEHETIGLTQAAAFQNAAVTVVLDSLATVSAANITAESTLTPGELYYLSRYKGEVTSLTNASGTVEATNGYGALVVMGTAVSTTQLELEINSPIILVP